jgi:hypothetical protein
MIGVDKIGQIRRAYFEQQRCASAVALRLIWTEEPFRQRQLRR